jgi:hypothetical protein
VIPGLPEPSVPDTEPSLDEPITDENPLAAQKLGYEVTRAAFSPRAEDGSADDGFYSYYRVKGFGLDIQPREDEAETWESLLRPEAHEERVRQDGETLEETQQRLMVAERERLIEEGKPLGAMEEADPAA